jgi:hypothetical protein
MRGLGRLIALPFLLIALAVQGLAPAQAQAMPRDAFGFPICSARDLGGSHKQDPAGDHTHDCCAAACALAGLAGGPAPSPQVARVSFGAPAVFTGQPRIDGRAASPDRPPNARAPPVSSLTI